MVKASIRKGKTVGCSMLGIYINTPLFARTDVIVFRRGDSPGVGGKGASLCGIFYIAVLDIDKLTYQLIISSCPTECSRYVP